jgi:predicted acylesterase/phospholipase RssA
MISRARFPHFRAQLRPAAAVRQVARGRGARSWRAILALWAALLWSPGAAATEGEDLRALEAATTQLEHCRSLVEDRAEDAALAGCFRYAALLLHEGLRRRRAQPGGIEEFEARLAAGVAELTSRLEALSIGDRARLEEELRELDGAIRSLRAELSRVAAVERVRISLVSRGGASLGNWQGGFLYLVTEWAKSRPGRRAGPGVADPAFSTVTGASAGAVNGLVAAIESCRAPNPSVQDSLYYQVWIGLGLFGRHGSPGLFPTERGGSTALSLFTSEALEATLAKAKHDIASHEPLPSCAVDFGFVATHMAPTDSPVHVRESGDPILTTKQLKEKFTVRLRSPDAPAARRDPGAGRLGIRNIGPPAASQGDQLYYAGLGHDREVSLDSLLEGIRASAAFPGAFPPVPLAYTQYVPGPDGRVRPREREATFIDGGILDNTPVGLAVSLDAWREDTPDSDPHLEGLVPPEPRTYLFLEPLVRSWSQREAQAKESPSGEETLMGTYLAFTGNLLATSADAQLTNTAEQFSFVRRERPEWNEPRLSVPERHMPIAGEQFENFMAFLEQDFRVFDFYVGMADAYEYLERERCFSAPEGESCQADEQLRSLDAALKQTNPGYRCIRAYYESPEASSLEPIDTERLPQECRELQQVACEKTRPPDSEKAVKAFLRSRAVSKQAERDRCFEPAIANHNFRALLAGMHNYKVWMQSDAYSESEELDRFFETLGRGEPSERFIYVDLPTHLGRNDGYLDPAEARRGFRSLVQEGIDQLASEQPVASEYALEIAGSTAADALYGRFYPRHIFGLGVAQNGLEAVYGRRLGERPWRWDTTFRLFNLRRQSFAPGLDPFTGEFYLSTQATRILSPTKFADIELGAGWAVSETFAFNSKSPGHIAFRTGPRSYLALVLLQRLYLALNVDYYPVNEQADAYRNTGTNVADDWEFNLTGGWRFLF